MGKPRLAVDHGATSAFTGSPASQVTVYVQDQYGNARQSLDTVRVAVTSSNAAVATLDSTTLTVLPDAGSAAGALLGYTGEGYTIIRAADARAGFAAYAAFEDTLTVRVPGISAYGPPSLGIGQYDSTQVSLDRTLDNGGAIAVTSSDPAVVQVPTTADVAPFDSYAYVMVTGAAPGSATVRLSLAGFRDTTLVVRVAQGKLWGSAPGSVAAGSVSALTLYLYDPDRSYTRPVKDSLTLDLGTSDANVQWVDASGAALAVPQVTAPPGATSVTVYLKATGAAGTVGQFRVDDKSGRFTPYVGGVSITP